MSTVIRRHQNDTKTFEELTAKEQAFYPVECVFVRKRSTTFQPV